MAEVAVRGAFSLTLALVVLTALAMVLMGARALVVAPSAGWHLLVPALLTMAVGLSVGAIAGGMGLLCALWLVMSAPKALRSPVVRLLYVARDLPPVCAAAAGLVALRATDGGLVAAWWVGGATLVLVVAPLVALRVRAGLLAVPRTVRNSATALGASKAQMWLRVGLPYAREAVRGALLAGWLRAVGEAVILAMVLPLASGAPLAVAGLGLARADTAQAAWLALSLTWCVGAASWWLLSPRQLRP